jgi:UDP-N-acetylglucosamine 3-dehydrogenase
MSIKPLEVAVVGAGQMGRLHVRVVAECEDTSLQAIVDEDPQAERLARERGVPWLGSVEELLRTTRPDLAIVALPTSGHVLARTLLEAGVPVLVEKPIASTLEEAGELIRAAAEAGVLLAVGHVERFNPAVRELRTRLEEGALGRVFQIHARRLSPFPTRIGDAGVALDLATHDLDMMCVLGGRPERIAAETDRQAHSTREDLLAAVLRLSSGAIGLLEVNWLTPTKVRQLSVTGERGMFVVDYLNQDLTLYENAHDLDAWDTLSIFTGVAEGNVTRFAIRRFEPLRAQLESVVAAIRGDGPVEVSGEQGADVLMLAMLAVESGRLGETVLVPPLSAADDGQAAEDDTRGSRLAAVDRPNG